MNRLQSELRRLYLPHAATDTGADAANLFDPHGATRALVLEVARQAGWEAVERVWRGVQSDLDLPAPGVAVNGSNGFQLWFSLEAPVGTPDARAFLEGLRQRFLAEVPADLVRSMPAPAGSGAAQHARLAPSEHAQPGQWSAFVTPDLAALFVDTPWLDFAPSVDGQADLLRGLRSIDRNAFDTVSARLCASPSIKEETGMAARAGETARASPAPGQVSGTTAPAGPESPEAFLLRVMRDESVALALRVEAARALLAHGRGTDLSSGRTA